ncbi:unnamed protein product [Rotaria sp. Silwood2]|nr:unnamed protein product [Rotaria sp. Silwood2]CAF2961397.1 unnamed protein product [Rotaria sp. Silwood2]CAF3137148.1 unnamed protein product [Rotaria sp. Silwood2]CAF3243593.1 unnamed protein product [Rotaria sp. Silwood2]CAF3928182.1 unnamed protein product [Rotaria sp. Silwood2]
MDDNDAHYRKIFRGLDPGNELKLGSSSNSPSPPPTIYRTRQDQIKHENEINSVDPLVGLDDLADQTPRSNDQLNHNSLPRTTNEYGENRFRSTRQTDNSDDEDN